MKTKLTLLVMGGSLVLAAPTLLAQNTNTNTNTLTQTVKYQAAFENDRSLGERCLLPPGLKEKLKLTAEQRTEMKLIEDDKGVKHDWRRELIADRRSAPTPTLKDHHDRGSRPDQVLRIAKPSQRGEGDSAGTFIAQARCSGQTAVKGEDRGGIRWRTLR